MTKETVCSFGDRREETLVAYLYDDMEAHERAAFERHMAGCQACRIDVTEFGHVREDLSTWSPPDVAAGVGGRAPRVAFRLVEPTAQASGWRTITNAPIWIQAAAAMLVVAASLGLANINLTYSRNGLTITTGWMRPSEPLVASATAPTTVAVTPAESAPWRNELVALEHRLQEQLDAVEAQPAATPSDDDPVMRRVLALLQESERRQQRELALRVAEVARDNQVQRQADLQRIDRSLGLIQSRAGVEVMRTQQQLNSLAQRVSQRE